MAPDHVDAQRGFTTKCAAEAYSNAVEVKKLTGEFIPETAGRITIAELAPDWLTRRGHWA
ncbi:MAG: hypothetical protein U5N53_02210 [Mycobacterium sp.]|nr:hypothetical protein [Mycobacterium sp.]